MRIKYSGKLLSVAVLLSIGAALSGCRQQYTEIIVEKKPIQYTVVGEGQIMRGQEKENNTIYTVLKAEAAVGWMFKEWKGVGEERKYKKEIKIAAGSGKDISAEFIKRKWTYVLYTSSRTMNLKGLR